MDHSSLYRCAFEIKSTIFLVTTTQKFSIIMIHFYFKKQLLNSDSVKTCIHMQILCRYTEWFCIIHNSLVSVAEDNNFRLPLWQTELLLWSNTAYFFTFSNIPESPTYFCICSRKITSLYKYLNSSGMNWVYSCSCSWMLFIGTGTGITFHNAKYSIWSHWHATINVPGQCMLINIHSYISGSSISHSLETYTRPYDLQKSS